VADMDRKEDCIVSLAGNNQLAVGEVTGGQIGVDHDPIQPIG